MQLSVPGASLYYEERGTGPVLVMICGGPTDAGVFAGVAAILSDRYRVITYDPRGNSRSIAEAPPADQNMDVHGDDAAALIAHAGGGPAFVFGNSGGGQIGLNLTARHPALVRALIAHEPPCMSLIDDPADQQALVATVRAAFRERGSGAAIAAFAGYVGMERSAERPAPEALATIDRMRGNLDFFFAHGMDPIAAYVPDVAALRSGPPVIVGAGEATADKAPHRAAVALAAQLGTAVVLFPGDHGGYGAHAPAFAATMDERYSMI